MKMGYNYNTIGQPWQGYYLTAYGIAVKHGFKGTEEEWLESLKGEQGSTGETGPEGPQGEQGEAGKDFEILGTYVSLAALEAAVPSPSVGDAYLVGASAPRSVYIYTGEWTDNGTMGISPTLSSSKTGKVTSIYYTDADHPSSTLLATINDGADGTGDMSKSTYDQNNVGTDIYAYADQSETDAITAAGTAADTKIQTALNRTTAVNAAFAGDYSSGIVQVYAARGEAFATSDTTPSVNGAICWTVE